MRKIMFGSGALLAVALFTAACGGGNGGDSAPSSSAPAASQPAAGGETHAITLTAKNFEFDQTEIKVKKGETVSITLKNGQGNHAVKIEGYDQEVKANKTVTFTADKAGEFKFFCSIMCGAGHNDMVGKLIVE